MRLRAWKEIGESDEACAQHLGLDSADYEQLLGKFHDFEAAQIRGRSTEETYVLYVQEQRRCIHDLDEVLEMFMSGGSRQHSAAVGAIRARSEIVDKIITRGQEFGIIDRKPQTVAVGGSIVHRMDDDQLRAAIEKELTGLHSVASRFGDVTEAQDFIDLDAGPMHRVGPKQKALPSETKPKRAKKGAGTKKNNVHGGRRRVREPVG